MNIKKKMMAIAMVGTLSLGFGASYDLGFLPAMPHYVEAAASSVEKTLALVTDETHSILSETDITALSDEQVRIHNGKELAVNYDFHTYIYASDSVTAKDKAKEISEQYIKQGNKVPFIFVLNKTTGAFYFVEDNRLAPYTSAAYMASLGEELFSKGVSTEAVKEFVTRVDSTLTMSVDGDFAFTGQMPINKQASTKYVHVQNFTDSLIDVLSTGADDLLLADMNEELVNLKTALALQIE